MEIIIPFDASRRLRPQNYALSPAPKPGAWAGPRAVEGILSEMAKRDIETHLGHKMKAFEVNKVVTEGGEFDADLILFMPCMNGLITPNCFAFSTATTGNC